MAGNPKWVKGVSGNPTGVAGRQKPFYEALRIEIASSAKGEKCQAPKGSLRYAARKLIERAAVETAALRELADRTDGKVPQAVGGAEELGPMMVVYTGVPRGDPE